jgi:MFS family permease
MHRIVNISCAIIGALIFALYAYVGGYILGMTEAPDPMPVWLWNLVFISFLLTGIIGFTYCVFLTLDELFLAPDDTRRITGVRKTYKVTRRPDTCDKINYLDRRSHY